MLPGVIGLVQATEAVKVLLGIGESLIGRLLTYDALGMRFREVRLRRDPKCPLCGTSPTITDLSIHRAGADGASAADANGHGAPALAGARRRRAARLQRPRLGRCSGRPRTPALVTPRLGRGAPRPRA